MNEEIACHDTVRLMSGTANPELMPLIGHEGKVVGFFPGSNRSLYLVQFEKGEPFCLLPVQLRLVAKATTTTKEETRRTNSPAVKRRRHPWRRRRERQRKGISE
jgi:hypothetical protein